MRLHIRLRRVKIMQHKRGYTNILLPETKSASHPIKPVAGLTALGLVTKPALELYYERHEKTNNKLWKR